MLMDDLESLVSDAIRAVTIYPKGSFSWFAERDGALPPSIRLTRIQRLEHLRLRLQHQLYPNFYCLGLAAPVEAEEDGETADVSAFVEQLSRANSGKGIKLDDWNLRLRPGAINELRRISPGFYTALGDARLDAGAPLLRIYWNLRADGAVPFIRESTRIFNGARLPFRAKVIDDPRLFSRCDAAVVYVRRRDHGKVYPLLDGLHRHLHRYLKTLVPVFAKRIAPGVAVAEDPPGGESFGQHRCRLLAEALIRAHEKRRTSTAARLHEVITLFERRGISFRRPFLNRGARDVYPLLSA